MALKLFVVGSNSSKREDWGIWAEVALVLANDAPEAVRLVERSADTKVAEIVLEGEPRVLLQMPEPNWGADT